ncbi:MAG: PilZ domain-containing protein [Bradyrhizobium sp.]
MASTSAFPKDGTSVLNRTRPSQLDRAGEGGAVLVRRAALLKQGKVDPFVVDAAVLGRLDRIGDLEQLAGSGMGIGEVARFDEFHGRLYRSLRISTHHSFMERRAIPRNPVLMSGAIRFAASTINCLIRNISISGAALDVINPHDIPELFNLVFKADGTHIPCHVIWRQQERIGVAFD